MHAPLTQCQGCCVPPGNSLCKGTRLLLPAGLCARVAAAVVYSGDCGHPTRRAAAVRWVVQLLLPCSRCQVGCSAAGAMTGRELVCQPPPVHFQIQHMGFHQLLNTCTEPWQPASLRPFLNPLGRCRPSQGGGPGAAGHPSGALLLGESTVPAYPPMQVPP